jgi:hypothetical protein
VDQNPRDSSNEGSQSTDETPDPPQAPARHLAGVVDYLRVRTHSRRCRPDRWFGYAPRLDYALLLVVYQTTA